MQTNPAVAPHLINAQPDSSAFSRTLAGQAVLAVAASLFVALCAHVSIRVPFTPVPFTLSDFAVLLVGLALSPPVAFAALALYLAEGASGLPVFNPGSLGLFGPTGGYLFAYPFAAFLASTLRRRLSAISFRFVPALVAAFTASTLIMFAGTLWLGLYLHLSARAAFLAAADPFVPGQLVKIAAAAGIFSSLERWRRTA